MASSGFAKSVPVASAVSACVRASAMRTSASDAQGAFSFERVSIVVPPYRRPRPPPPPPAQVWVHRVVGPRVGQAAGAAGASVVVVAEEEGGPVTAAEAAAAG